MVQWAKEEVTEQHRAALRWWANTIALWTPLEARSQNGQRRRGRKRKEVSVWRIEDILLTTEKASN